MPKIIYEGEKFTVEVAARSNGAMPAYDFMNKLPDRDQTKVMAIVTRLADIGHIRNKEKFKCIGNNLYEIKSFQIRIFCCFAKGRLIILISGYIKKSNKLKKTEINKALQIKDEYNKLRVKGP